MKKKLQKMKKTGKNYWRTRDERITENRQNIKRKRIKMRKTDENSREKKSKSAKIQNV